MFVLPVTFQDTLHAAGFDAGREQLAHPTPSEAAKAFDDGSIWCSLQLVVVLYGFRVACWIALLLLVQCNIVILSVMGTVVHAAGRGLGAKSPLRDLKDQPVERLRRDKVKGVEDSEWRRLLLGVNIYPSGFISCAHWCLVLLISHKECIHVALSTLFLNAKGKKSEKRSDSEIPKLYSSHHTFTLIPDLTDARTALLSFPLVCFLHYIFAVIT